MKNIVAVIGLAVVLTACAKRPDAITPMTMPVSAYSGLSCDQLANEHKRSTELLEAASKAQNSAATGDAIGVFLIGVPMSSVAGSDKEGVVAQHKGELIAIGAARRNHGC